MLCDEAHALPGHPDAKCIIRERQSPNVRQISGQMPVVHAAPWISFP
jgi:hypothetical protein